MTTPADIPPTTPTDPSSAAPTPAADPSPPAKGTPSGLSRRGLLGLLGVSATAGFVGGVASVAAAVPRSDSPSVAESYEFYGKNQAGIVTPAQDRLFFASYDMLPTATREDLIELLQDWTFAASRLTQGLDVSETGAVGGSPLLPPDDTGEALGLPASGLTLTFGLGPTLFTAADGTDRYGIADRQPTELRELPLFAFDILEEAQSGGDLCIQACANDPQVALHAIRNLSRIAFGRAHIRWSQLGFGRTSSTSTAQATPRNLFGFKDGTANIMAEDHAAVTRSVWADASGDRGWMAGGTYLVTRKIHMTIETWDRARLEEQENIFGRDKGEGAPLSGTKEFDSPNFDAVRSDGGPAIPVNSHVHLAHPNNNKGAQILRRGYNYVDGNNGLGQLNAGLFFISFQRSPEQFIRIQKKLATDALNEYIRHVGSALFAVPPGCASGGYIGEGLFT
ncbi:iron uptake transporter deferrochelatase/peroxidase subunit [Klugiella xanthotipulae]|uniref:Deferrochelatase n=1 Tax=Klugiella xanthotipulae TaxID=244735 RepID=A0A543HXP6_9MICO|nr:iron uptake transporter deferrochelatase/peroxidase subunit [Klugiella xanthotipulae]TQM63040.1 deferrochelatase/peroxidase EfeB [Klugiella xanthotipulae]